MSNIIGHTKDLNASRTEALQGLLSSLRHHDAGDSASAGTTLSSEQLQILSQKFSDILGDDFDRGTTPRDQPSQLLNDDGLPIIDISEPVDEVPQSSGTLSSPVLVEQDLVPLPLLSADERERRRRERDRILDLLEEEEHLQQLREERDAEEERKEAIKKRRESAKAELDQLKAARELHKKMGRALVQRAEGAREAIKEEDLQSKAQDASSVVKKSVTFADAPPAAEANGKGEIAAAHPGQPDWGDVVPGRLRAQGRIPLVSTFQEEEYPMKMHVVERHPAGTPASSFRPADSDDESTSSTGQISPSVDNDSPEQDGYSSSNNGISDDEPLEEGFDYDAAQHHREIALEYHKRRHTVGAETAKAMAGDILDDSEDQGTSNGQSALSRFRADRMAAAYDKSRSSASTSIGHSVIPASRQKSLRSSVRLGKLENDQLVGGRSGESGSEDENVRELVQMLQTGSIENAGPDFNPSSTSTITSSRDSNALEPSLVDSASTPRGARLSRFKLVHGGHAETTTYQSDHAGDNSQLHSAISRVVERKAPSRSTPSQHFPINKPPPRSSTQISGPTTPMIIDSPSFPMPANGSTVTVPSSSPHPMSIGSASRNSTRLERPPAVKSSVTQVSPERPVSNFITERKK